MLFDGARTDAELPGDLFVAATLHQQIKHLLISRCDFDSLDIYHGSSSDRAFVSFALTLHLLIFCARPTRAKAGVSPKLCFFRGVL